MVIHSSGNPISHKVLLFARGKPEDLKKHIYILKGVLFDNTFNEITK